jgi:uncharacterized protein YndB with AHSA1/START domain
MASATETLPEFRLERTFAATREEVWAAWTQPGNLEKWFGPKGCRAESMSFDLKPGGVALTKLSFPGMVIYARFVFREIVAPRKLSWLHAVADETGRVTKHPMGQALPGQMLVVMELEDLGASTRLKLVKTPFEATADEVEAFREAMQGMRHGWGGNFDVLDAFLAGKR